jgi:hypothetical protein
MYNQKLDLFKIKTQTHIISEEEEVRSSNPSNPIQWKTILNLLKLLRIDQPTATHHSKNINQTPPTPPPFFACRGKCESGGIQDADDS